MTATPSQKATVEQGKLVNAAFLSDPALVRLFAILHTEGEEARAVGGAVRNALAGLPVHEVDIATTGTPDVVIARCQAAGLRVIPTGVDHGTVTVLIEGTAFEVTTLRADVETDGRHAKVRFGRDFHQDALRRDFTINALSVTPDGTLFDVTGGLADLTARRVRFIGVAAQRIREDYLRALRFFRFSASFSNGTLDADAFAAILQTREGLLTLSRERIQAEVFKLLAAPLCVDVVRAMDGAGLWGLLTGGVATPARLFQVITLEKGLQHKPDLVLRCAALLVSVREDAARLRDRLRLSNKDEARLVKLATALESLHNRKIPPPPGDIRNLMFIHGKQAAHDALFLTFATSGAGVADAGWQSALRFAQDTPEPNLPFKGADLLARGVPTGRRMGAVLKHLQAAWIRAGFPQEPDKLNQLLEEALSHQGSS